MVDPVPTIMFALPKQSSVNKHKKKHNIYMPSYILYHTAPKAPTNYSRTLAFENIEKVA